jgi:hypothetical protein
MPEEEPRAFFEGMEDRIDPQGPQDQRHTNQPSPDFMSAPDNWIYNKGEEELAF